MDVLIYVAIGVAAVGVLIVFALVLYYFCAPSVTAPPAYYASRREGISEYDDTKTISRYQRWRYTGREDDMSQTERRHTSSRAPEPPRRTGRPTRPTQPEDPQPPCQPKWIPTGTRGYTIPMGSGRPPEMPGHRTGPVYPTPSPGYTSFAQGQPSHGMTTGGEPTVYTMKLSQPISRPGINAGTTFPRPPPGLEPPSTTGHYDLMGPPGGTVATAPEPELGNYATIR